MDGTNIPWSKQSRDELKPQLKARGLPTTGLKADMIARLEKYDAEHRPVTRPPPATSYAPTSAQHNLRFTYDDRRRDRVEEQSRRNPNTNPSAAPLVNPRIPSSGGMYERQRELEREERARARSPSSDPSQRRRHDWDFSSPRPGRAPLTETNLEEADLEAICWDNFSRLTKDPRGIQRRATIKTEFDVKFGDLRTKKVAALERIERKYSKDVNALEKEKDMKLDELEKETRPYIEKERRWNPAFGQLKRLRAARGLETFPNDFSPDRVVSRRFTIPASNISESAATATVLSQDSPAPTSLRRRTNESATNLPSFSQTPDNGRSQDPPATNSINCEANEFTPTTPSTTRTPDKRRPQESPATTNPLKRRISQSSPPVPSSEASSKRARDSSDYIQTKSGPIPIRPLADTAIENIPINPTIKSSTPYIFLPEVCIKVRGGYLEAMKTMIGKRGYDFKAVRADDTGYFITFEDSEKGKNDARKMHNWYDKEMFKGKVMHLQIYNYE